MHDVDRAGVGPSAARKASVLNHGAAAPPRKPAAVSFKRSRRENVPVACMMVLRVSQIPLEPNSKLQIPNFKQISDDKFQFTNSETPGSGLVIWCLELVCDL